MSLKKSDGNISHMKMKGINEIFYVRMGNQIMRFNVLDKTHTLVAKTKAFVLAFTVTGVQTNSSMPGENVAIQIDDEESKENTYAIVAMLENEDLILIKRNPQHANGYELISTH